MVLINTLNWINISIIAGGLTGVIIAWVVWYKHVNAVYLMTKRWIQRHRHRVNELAEQSSGISSVWSERSKWLQKQILDGLYGSRIQLFNEQETNLKHKYDELVNSIKQLSSLYSEKISAKTNQIKASWGAIVGSLRARTSKLEADNRVIGEELSKLESEYSQEIRQLTESQGQKKASWVDNIVDRLIERGKKIRTHLRSAIQSVLSLWLVYLLLIIDAYFMHEAIEPLFTYYVFWGWIISFSAVVLFLALFELLYVLIFTKKQSNMPFYRVFQVVLITPIAISTARALFFLKDVRSEDAGIVETAIKQFGFYMLPLAIFLVAKLIYDYNHNPNNKRDALIVVIESVINQLFVMFWLILRPIFSIRPQKVTPTLRRLQKNLDDKKNMRANNISEIKEIEDVKIPNAKENEENAIKNMETKFREAQEKNRIWLNIEKGKINKAIDKVKEVRENIQKQCYHACIDFISINAG